MFTPFINLTTHNVKTWNAQFNFQRNQNLNQLIVLNHSPFKHISLPSHAPQFYKVA